MCPDEGPFFISTNALSDKCERNVKELQFGRLLVQPLSLDFGLNVREKLMIY